MMAMNCKELELEWCDRLQSPTHPAEDWSPAALQHFAVCDSCRQQHAADGVLERAINVWQRQPQPEWTPDCAAYLGELVSDSQPQVVPAGGRPLSTGDGAGVLAALLASCAVAVMALVGISSNERVRGTVPNGGSLTAQATSTAPGLEVTAFMSELWQGMRHGSANAAQLTVASLSFPASSSDQSDPTLPEAADDLASTEETSLPWLELGRPVSEQIGAAFRFLGDVLPTSEDSAS